MDCYKNCNHGQNNLCTALRHGVHHFQGFFFLSPFFLSFQKLHLVSGRGGYCRDQSPHVLTGVGGCVCLFIARILNGKTGVEYVSLRIISFSYLLAFLIHLLNQRAPRSAARERLHGAAPGRLCSEGRALPLGTAVNSAGPCAATSRHRHGV